jgi:three-Cys-motif partner protein
MICRNCNYKKNAPKDICTLKNASDGLPIRCVGLWAKDKYFYLGKYLEIFTVAMKNKWGGELYYIDLFAGCGKFRVRDTEEEIDGSALMALSVKYLFKKYFLVELVPSTANILKKRIEKSSSRDRVNIIQGDCNEKIDEIIKEIPHRSLILTVVDPTGLHITFDALRKLTKDRRIDLVITFPEGMDIKRNIARYLKQSHSILDDYFGAEEWRKIFTKDVRNLSQLSSAFIEKYLIDYYRKKLVEIGYKEIKSGEEILIKSSQKKLPLYYLLFASKHPLGHKFWKEISKISPTGQISFSLNNNSDNLVRENSAEYLPVKLKLVYKDYKLLEGRTKKLVERVSDGSIITRFNKTPFPESLNDVV